MMSKMTQRAATFAAICAVTGHTGEGDAVVISKEQRAQVNMILFEGFKAGTIQLDKEYTDSDLKSYVSGLQSNWIRKDPRLNGGQKYTAKNPGSRAGSTDPSIKAMRVLLGTLTDESERAEVQSHIDARQSELNAAKQTKVVDFSVLPAELQAKFQK